MINTLRRSSVFSAAMAVVLFAAATPVHSQAPTDAQRSAIRSQCRSDYQAHCATISPGGRASLQCLQQNMASLSPGCQASVRAVEAPATPQTESAPAAPKTESAPAASKTDSAPAAATETPAAETAAPPPPPTSTAGAKPATSPAARTPGSAQATTIRSACRSDYQKNCAGIPAGGAAALSCLEKNKASLSASCQTAVGAAGGTATPAAGGAPADAATASPATAPAAAALVLRPMRPREMVFVLRSGCGEDARALCGDVPPGGGRIIQCLAAQAASLSPACANVLSQFTAQ